MKYLFTLFLITVSIQGYSNIIGESYFCNEADRYNYKNISCCTKRISISRCEELVDKYISPKQAKLIENVISGIKDNKWDWGYYPNCFWGAHAFGLDEVAKNPQVMSESKFYSLLYENYDEVSLKDNKYGDLIVFNDNFDLWVWGFYHKREWELHRDEATHAAIYLEDGFAFQKESQLGLVFSIDTVDHIISLVHDWLLIPIRRSNEFVTVDVFRPKR